MNQGLVSTTPQTLACRISHTDKVRNGFEKGSLTGMILIDVQKAFDTIDHKILIEKISKLVPQFRRINNKMI